jgi:branched-chain amino acid transport system ATP-binding protein
VSLLEVRDLRTGYGQLPVLQGISFDVPENNVTVVFGLNGAGKSTTINALAGLLPCWKGSLTFAGEDITKLDAAKTVARGMALSPEGRRVFPALSVETNLRLGAWTRRRDRKQTTTSMDAVFDYFPRLAERRSQLAGTMSGGEQQMLAIGRAMMSRPRILLVDEASLGLSPKLAQTVFQVVRKIADDGTTVVIVEQNVGILPYADRALVMEKGTLTYDGDARELERTGDLQKAYLG